MAQVDPSRPDVARAIVEWLVDAAKAPQLTIEVANDDHALGTALDRVGFTRQADAGSGHGMRRPVLTVAPPPVAGYSVRAVQPGETGARVEVHRAAWRPASLPWHRGHQPPTDPDATSSFTREGYEAVRNTWLYDPGFDLVAVAPDGSLAACCIAWLDPSTGVAEIEPLGVAPNHRRRGLAGALCLEVAARVGRAGGHEVFINTSPSDAYPAPAGAYAKAGFEVINRTRTYGLRRDCGTGGGPVDGNGSGDRLACDYVQGADRTVLETHPYPSGARGQGLRFDM